MNSKKPRVVLIVDHPLRDLAGLTLTAIELARLGADAYLVPMAFQARDTFALKPDYVAINYIRNNNAVFIDRLIAAGIPYGLIDTEGGFYSDLSKFRETLGHNRSHWDKLTRIFVWGEKMHRFFRDEFGLPEHKLLLTGQARFDLYSEKYRSRVRGLLPDEWRASSRPLVLFNTKVAVANPQFVTRQQEIQLYTEVLKLPMSLVERHIRLGEASIEATAEISTAVARNFPDVDVVIRPHPHERLQTYEEKLAPADLENLHVIREGGVTPWLTRSSLLIQRHCTTAIEAALAGLPVLAPQWWPTSAFLPDAEDLSIKSHSPEELMEQIALGLRGQLKAPPEVRATLKRIIDDWLYRVDGDSGLRVAKGILAVTSAGSGDQKRYRHELYASHAERTGTLGRIARWTGRLADMGLRRPFRALEQKRSEKWRAGGKSFSTSDVRRLIDLLDDSGLIDAFSCESEALDCCPTVAVKVASR